MVRIGVYRGTSQSQGLTMLNFEVLNELEQTNIELDNFQLVSRMNKWKEPLKEDVIYFINIIPGEQGKPIDDFEILDKCKFVKYDLDGNYIISYRMYKDKNLIELARLSPSTLNHTITKWCRNHKGKSKLKFNTFTKYILENIFELYNIDSNKVNVLYQENERNKWSAKISELVKNHVKNKNTAFTIWSTDELHLLMVNIDTEERLVSNKLNRTIASIASRKYKLTHDRDEKEMMKEYLDNLSDSEYNALRLDHKKRNVMESNEDKISKLIKDFRKKNGNITQTQLHEKTGISLSVISQLESGRYNINSDITKKLLMYINENDKSFDVSEFINGELEVTTNLGKNVVEKQTQSIDEDFNKAVENIDHDDPNNTIILEMLSELKFVSGQLLNIKKMVIKLANKKNTVINAIGVAKKPNYSHV